jgi:hypothetical protein
MLRLRTCNVVPLPSVIHAAKGLTSFECLRLRLRPSPLRFPLSALKLTTPSSSLSIESISTYNDTFAGTIGVFITPQLMYSSPDLHLLHWNQLAS